jgi:hypothetical protein
MKGLMANDTKQVDLLRSWISLIISVTESHYESMNHLGSEGTHIARLNGPSGFVMINIF